MTSRLIPRCNNGVIVASAAEWRRVIVTGEAGNTRMRETEGSEQDREEFDMQEPSFEINQSKYHH